MTSLARIALPALLLALAATNGIGKARVALARKLSVILHSISALGRGVPVDGATSARLRHS